MHIVLSVKDKYFCIVFQPITLKLRLIKIKLNVKFYLLISLLTVPGIKLIDMYVVS